MAQREKKLHILRLLEVVHLHVNVLKTQIFLYETGKMLLRINKSSVACQNGARSVCG